MTGDLVLARPALFALTVVGTATFVVSLPFSLLGGNFGNAGKTLVVGPGKATFVALSGLSATAADPKYDNVADNRRTSDQVAAN